jgi:hypothetical protein
MANEALFIGWGEVVRGRERKALEVFNESIQYYTQLQQDGKIESVEPWFLAPHGGDLAGFILLRGERGQLDEIERSTEFERLQTRAGLIVDRRDQRLHRRGARSADGPVRGRHSRPGRIATPHRARLV